MWLTVQNLFLTLICWRVIYWLDKELKFLIYLMKNWAIKCVSLKNPFNI